MSKVSDLPPLEESAFFNTYEVTITHKVQAHSESKARSGADYYTRVSTTIEKVQDRSVPYRQYLRDIKDRDNDS